MGNLWSQQYHAAVTGRSQSLEGLSQFAAPREPWGLAMAGRPAPRSLSTGEVLERDIGMSETFTWSLWHRLDCGGLKACLGPLAVEGLEWACTRYESDGDAY